MCYIGHCTDGLTISQLEQGCTEEEGVAARQADQAEGRCRKAEENEALNVLTVAYGCNFNLGSCLYIGVSCYDYGSLRICACCIYNLGRPDPESYGCIPLCGTADGPAKDCAWLKGR